MKCLVYNNPCCDMIAMKREVAVEEPYAGFPWSECQVRKLATSHCTIKTNYLTTGKRYETTCEILTTHTESVQSPLVVLEIKSTKRRRLFLWQVK